MLAEGYQQKAAASARRLNRVMNAQEKREAIEKARQEKQEFELTAKVWDDDSYHKTWSDAKMKHEADLAQNEYDEIIQVDGIAKPGYGTVANSGGSTPQYVKSAPRGESAAVRNALNAAKLGSLNSLEKGNYQSADISLELEQMYDASTDKDIKIRSIEPFQGRFRSDINLGIGEIYEKSTNKDISIQSIEPFQSRSSSDIHLGLDEIYEKSHNRAVKLLDIEPMTNSTENWAQKMAMTEGVNVARSGRMGSHNRSNAKEYFCGRRQYNPDIPPCSGPKTDGKCRAHEDFPSNRGCNPCDGYAKVYHTGLTPAESTDPTCIYCLLYTSPSPRDRG